MHSHEGHVRVRVSVHSLSLCVSICAVSVLSLCVSICAVSVLSLCVSICAVSVLSLCVSICAVSVLSLCVSICAVSVLSLSGDQGQEGEHAIQPSCGDQTLHGSRDLGRVLGHEPL